MARTKYNTPKRSTLSYHDRVEKIFKKFEDIIKRPLRFTTKRSFEALLFLIVFFGFFGFNGDKEFRGCLKDLADDVEYLYADSIPVVA